MLHPQTYADAAFGGTVGGGEAYMRGLWRADDLTALIRLMLVNRDVMQSMEGGAALLTAPLRRSLHWLNRNSPDGSRRNIAAHYDLGNDLFALMLDETMAYSCAVFERDDATLHEAQVAKFERICRKLQLSPQRPPARDRHGLGRVRNPRRQPLRLPGDHHHDLARAARLGAREDRGGRRCRTASRCCSTTTATCAGATTSWSRSR